MRKKRRFSKYLNEKRILILPLFILFLFFFANSLTTSPQVVISLETDKEEYRSADVMYVYIEVTSEEYLGEAFLRIHGITNKFGVEYLNEYRLVELNFGTTQVDISEILPVCSACSGLAAGTYVISAEVILNDIAIGSATKSIEIH
jgi:hypothetical protein